MTRPDTPHAVQTADIIAVLSQARNLITEETWHPTAPPPKMTLGNAIRQAAADLDKDGSDSSTLPSAFYAVHDTLDKAYPGQKPSIISFNSYIARDYITARLIIDRTIIRLSGALLDADRNRC